MEALLNHVVLVNIVSKTHIVKDLYLASTARLSLRQTKRTTILRGKQQTSKPSTQHVPRQRPEFLAAGLKAGPESNEERRTLDI